MRKLQLGCAVAAVALSLASGCGTQESGEGGSTDTTPVAPTPGEGTNGPVAGTPGTSPGTPAPGTEPGTQPGTEPGTPTPPVEEDVLPTPRRTLEAKSLEALRSLIAEAQPGDRIELADGTYENQTAIVVSARGTEADPIVITAKNVGGAALGGAAGFTVKGASHVVLRGFKLTHGVAEGAVAFRMDDSHHVRITRNTFALTDTTANSTWMRVDGVGSGNNRIDHNVFRDKASSNVFLGIVGDAADGSPGMSQHDRIDHNYFLSQTFPSEGGECLRIGDSKRALVSANIVVEENLFEKCDGDPEVISTKSSDVTLRHNTLRNNKGSLVLRHGNRNRVDGNFILGNVGGMRVYGHDHVIVNNYLEANSGAGAESTLVLNSGCSEADTGSGADCSRPVNVTVAFNTLVGNTATHLVLGSTSATRPLPPRDCRIENNLIVGDTARLVDFAATPENPTFVGNVLWGAAQVGDIPASGYVKADPRLTRAADELLRPAAGSALLGAAVLSADTLQVTTDMDGQLRTGALDVGADQALSLAPARRPLTPADVGPLAP